MSSHTTFKVKLNYLNLHYLNLHYWPFLFLVDLLVASLAGCWLAEPWPSCLGDGGVLTGWLAEPRPQCLGGGGGRGLFSCVLWLPSTGEETILPLANSAPPVCMVVLTILGWCHSVLELRSSPLILTKKVPFFCLSCNGFLVWGMRLVGWKIVPP